MKVPAALPTLLCTMLLIGAASTHAQTAAVSRPTPIAASAPTAVPTLVPYAGVALDRSGNALSGDNAVTFLIFKEEQGGEPLWVETQTVAVDAAGRYDVQLGAGSPAGLATTTFASGEGRWLEVQIAGQPVQARVLLSSVPYAMKAAEAETLGGFSAQNFVTQAQLAAAAKDLAAKASPLITPFVMPSGSGSPNSIPVWTSSTVLGNSVMAQSGGNINIGTAATAASLGVYGNISNSASGTYTNFTSSSYNSVGYEGSRIAFNRYDGTLTAPTVVQPNDTVGWFDFFAYDGSIAQRVGQFSMFVDATPSAGVVPGRFEIETASSTGADTPRLIAYSNDNVVMSTHGGKVGIGIGSPGATLEVNGTAKFDGNITFASSQVFPIKGTGGGTITGITTSSPLTGSGTAGSVALGLNETKLTTDITPALEGTFNSLYAQLGASNTFQDYSDFQDGISSNMALGSNYAAVNAEATNGSEAVYAASDSGYGVRGGSTTGVGVFGATIKPPIGGIGVLGSAGNGFSNSYTQSLGYDYAGVWADTNGTGSSGTAVALMATADNANAAILANNSSDAYALSVTNIGGSASSFTAGGEGDALDAHSDIAGNGVYATTAGSGSGVYGVTEDLASGFAGVMGVGSSTSGVSTFNLAAGVWGDTSLSSNNRADTFISGVLGTADNSEAGTFVNNSASYPTIYTENMSSGGSTGLFKTFMAKSAAGTCGIGGGSMSCTGPIKSLVTAADGAKTVETYGVQSSENWMEDAGSGTIERGVGVVQIDPSFAETISNDASYHVFITPNGDSKGLYVIAKTPTTFEVRESGGGTSSLSFDYRIMAKRRGFEAQRLVDVTERYNSEIKTASLRKSSRPGQPAAGQRAMVRKASPLTSKPGARHEAAAPRLTPTQGMLRPGQVAVP
jgi:hypothetical protein